MVNFKPVRLEENYPGGSGWELYRCFQLQQLQQLKKIGHHLPARESQNVKADPEFIIVRLSLIPG